MGRRIQHRELVADVSSYIVFTPTEYHLNPGLAGTFPWLSTQALAWEQYHFNSLRFEYITRTSTANGGSIILTPEYDPLDPVPLDEKQATNNADSVEAAPWSNFTCVLDPSALHPNGPRKFVRTSRTAGDLRNYDVGTLVVSGVGSSSIASVGKLWVCYDIEFFSPQTGAPDGPTQTTTSYLAAEQTLTSNTDTALVWANVIRAPDALHWRPAGTATTTIQSFLPPAGSYNIDLQIESSDSSAEAVTISSWYIMTDSVIGTTTGPMTVNQSTVAAAGKVLTHSMWTITVDSTVTGFTFMVNMVGGGTLKVLPSSLTLFRVTPA